MVVLSKSSLSGLILIMNGSLKFHKVDCFMFMNTFQFRISLSCANCQAGDRMDLFVGPEQELFKGESSWKLGGFRENGGKESKRCIHIGES